MKNSSIHQNTLAISKLLPTSYHVYALPVICFQCQQVNPAHHHYCTVCGDPIWASKQHVSLYKARIKGKRGILKQCLSKVAIARTVLYISAAMCALGISYFFEDSWKAILRGGLFVVIALLFSGLGKWSVSKPFWAMVASIGVMVTLVALNTWVTLNYMLTTIAGIYLMVVQLTVLYFLMQGVFAAYQAEILTGKRVAEQRIK